MATVRNAIIAKCTCHSEFQDLTYGKGNRVWSPAGDKTGYRCTVCGAVMGDARTRKKPWEK